MSAAADFHGAMAAASIEYHGAIIADGQLHRIKINGDPGQNGWYVLHTDGIAAGSFGCWKRDIKEKWCAKSSEQLTEAERAERDRRWKQQAEEREAERRRVQDEASIKAQKIIDAAQPATDDHPYLQRKRVQAHPGVRVGHWPQRKVDNALLIPLRTAAGKLASVQAIFSERRGDRDKDFLKGGAKADAYFVIGDLDASETILIAEGYATAATLHEVTGHAAVVAMDAGNLAAVAQAIRVLHPDKSIIMCADNDRHTTGNPGLTKATAAAKSIKAALAVPEFADGEDGSDFNDLAQIDIERVLQAIAEAESNLEQPDRSEQLDYEISQLEALEDKDAARLKSREFINANASDLHALWARQRTAFVEFKERLIALKGYGSRDFNAVIQQAGESTERDITSDEQRAWLQDFVFLIADDRIADKKTGGVFKFGMFDKLAEGAFPSCWGNPKPSTHLARSGALFVRHDCYHPGEPRIVEKESTIGIIEPLLNIYNKPVWPTPVYHAEHEKLFYDHLMFISGEDKSFVEVLLNFIATLVQKPEQRINWIPLLIAPSKGTGRGLLLQILTAILGKSNVGIVNSSAIGGDFQDALIYKQLIAIDEFRMFEKANEKLNEFKSYVTEPRIPANRKGRAQITVDNVGNYIAFSNYDNAIAIDRDERRYAVAICHAPPRPQTYYRNLAKTFLPSDGGGIEGLLSMLLARDLTSFDPKAPAISTDAREAMIDQSMSTTQRWFAKAAEHKEKPFEKDLFTYDMLDEFVQSTQSEFFSPSGKSLAGFKLTPYSLGRVLNAISAASIGRKRLAGSTRKETVYAIRDIERWRNATEGEIRDYLGT